MAEQMRIITLLSSFALIYIIDINLHNLGTSCRFQNNFNKPNVGNSYQRNTESTNKKIQTLKHSLMMNVT